MSRRYCLSAVIILMVGTSCLLANQAQINLPASKESMAEHHKDLGIRYRNIYFEKNPEAIINCTGFNSYRLEIYYKSGNRRIYNNICTEW